MQYRLQQASINDRERRILLSQFESREEAEKSLVMTPNCTCGNEHSFNLLPIRLQPMIIQVQQPAQQYR